jgi:FkbM family methyltransferase
MKKIKKIVRKLFRKLGQDIVPYNSEAMGINPYLDMTKFIKYDQPILFDVGANTGQTIDDFNTYFKNGLINSFEPSPSTFKILKDNTANMEHVSIWNCGMGSENSNVFLNENANSQMSSFLELGDEGWGQIKNKTSVKVTTIDEFCKEQKIKRIDVLKLDTQGYELEIFKGAESTILENKIGLLYFEVTFIDIYKELPSFTSLYDFCVKHGFELVSIYPLRYKKNMAGWTDVLFKHKSYNIHK